MVCVHADWAIGDVAQFRATLHDAATLAAREHALVTVGVVPSRPDPGFGYIQPGEAIPSSTEQVAARRVARFVEKPNRANAEAMVASGYLWNSGIFAWRVGDLLDEIRAHTPEVQPALDAAGDDLGAFFAHVGSVAIDVGVLERSQRVLVIPGQFGWDDVGTWAALHRVRAHDAHENATGGRTVALQATGNVVHADGPTVVLYGVNDLVVVANGDVVLVTTREKAADLKTLLDSLPADLR
jgi:mannose-1-phosphate guanylyltransferase